MISANGIDSIDCGKNTPCRTIGFVLTHRATNNDIIKIENDKFSKHPEPFIIHSSFPILRNITLLGIHGRPTISTETLFHPTHLFEEKGLQKLKLITLQIRNLIFKDIGIANLINVTSDNNILFQNCYVENTVTGRNIIRIESDPYKPYTGKVYFRHCQFFYNAVLQSSWAISVMQIHSVFHKCHFENNFSAASGLIFVAGGFSQFVKTHFKKNMANAIAGAVYGSDNSVIEILNSSFIQNKASHAGGAVCLIGRKLGHYLKTTLHLIIKDTVVP